MKVMGSFAVFHALLIATLIPTISSVVEVLQPNDEVCLGAPVAFTCTVNGTSLGWRFGGFGGEADTYIAPSGSTANFRPLGSSPFSTRITSVSGGIITSIATSSNLTRDANERTLECSNGLFFSGVETDTVTLPFQDSSAVLFVSEEVIGSSLPELIIHICWPKCTCAPSYRVNITNDNNLQLPHDNITEDTCYEYNVTVIGTYTVYVNSIDYFGAMVGEPANTAIHIRPPDIQVFPSYNYTSNTISIIIQDSVEDQLPIISCNIRLITNDGSNIKDCIQGRRVNFTNATCGQIYTYSVTISNVVNSTTESGTINLTCIEPSVTTITIRETVSYTLYPSCSPGPPTDCDDCELCLWALILIIALGVLFVSAVAFIVMELCWRQRCCNVECWDSLFWTYLFCDCLRNCCCKEEKIRAMNRETESPGGKETKM